MRPDKQSTKEAEEAFEMVDIEEVDTVLLSMGGFTAKNITGTCTLWICDQNDPSGTSVREKSTTFACSATVKAGTTKFGGGDFSKMSVHILSLANAPVTFTANATS
jgi:hypothetical protein